MEVAAGGPGGGPVTRLLRSTSWRTITLYGVALLLACACVVGGVLSFRTYQDRQDEKAEQERYGEVIAAATKEAEAFLNIDYRDPDATLDAVSEGATGEFREQYEQALGQEGDEGNGSDTATLIDLMIASKSVMTAEVVNAAVSSVDKDSARVLIASDGTVQNTGAEGQEQARTFRLALELVRLDGKWLTNNLEFVG